MGLRPDGDRVVPGTPAPAVVRTPAATALRTVAFWQLGGSFFTCGFSMALVAAHGVPMLTDHGYTPMFASWVIGVLGASSIVFTLTLGTLSDRFGARPVLAAIYAGRALIFAGLFLIRDNPAAMIGVAIVGGITLAGSMSMTSVLTADIYGRYSVGSILGVIFLVHQTGAALGSWLAGALFEATGGYGAMFAIASILLAAAGLVSLRVDREPRALRWVARGARA
jgi:MFS family permease